MGNWINELREELRDRAQQQSFQEAVQLHRAEVLKTEGRFLFEQIRHGAGVALGVIASDLNLTKDVHFADHGRDHFTLTRSSPYPVATVDVRLSPRRILVKTATRKEAAGTTDEVIVCVDLCVKADDKIYLCCNGEPLGGGDDVLRLIFRSLFV